MMTTEPKGLTAFAWHSYDVLLGRTVLFLNPQIHLGVPYGEARNTVKLFTCFVIYQWVDSLKWINPTRTRNAMNKYLVKLSAIANLMYPCSLTRLRDKIGLREYRLSIRLCHYTTCNSKSTLLIAAGRRSPDHSGSCMM